MSNPDNSSTDVCHKKQFIELHQTQPYRTGDGSWVSGKFTYWCKVCGTVRKYRYKEPYSDEIIMYEELKPTNTLAEIPQ